MGCNHSFIGHAEGVKCSLCGKEFSREEYIALIRGVKAEPKVETPKEAKAEKSVAPKKTIARPKKTAKK